MNFIKKIVDKNFDESVHLQFQKFSKGEFKNKAMIEAKNSNGKYTIKTSSEFANELVRTMSKKLGNEKTKVTGAIVSTLDLKEDLDYKEVKQFQGVKRYLIDKEMSGEEIINLLDKFPKNFFALSFSTPDGDILKIKPKAPKSGKPGSKGDDKPKVDFCSLKTTDKEIAKEFVFENPDFKKAEIAHKYIIEKLEIPEEAKKSGDFKKMREDAKRMGQLIRKAEIDDSVEEKEIELKA
jgi:hypothetical protein